MREIRIFLGLVWPLEFASLGFNVVYEAYF